MHVDVITATIEKTISRVTGLMEARTVMARKIGEKTSVRTQRGGMRLSLLATVAAAVILSGCSEIPGYLNPVEWYQGASDAIFGDDTEQPVVAETQSAQPKPIPGSGDDFPKLGNTPDVGKVVAQRQPARGLVGDTGNRSYGESVTRQGAATSVLDDPNKGKTAPAVPVVPATPKPASPSAETAPMSTPIEPPKMPEPPMAAAAPKPAMQAKSDMQAQLPTRAVAAKTPAAPVMPDLQASDPYATVVISSDGISFEDSGAGTSSYGTLATGSGYSGEVGASALANGALALDAAPGAEQNATRVATIQFGNGSASLDERDRGVLRDVAAIVKQRGGRRVIVVGHASSRTRNMDPVSHSMVNYEVSAQRADSVAKALMSFGVEGDRIQIAARADRQPMYYEVMPSGEAGNRRTDIYVEY